MKRSVKYLIIVLANLIVLTILLALWTDEVEMTFDQWVRPIEFLKILAFSFVALIAVRFYSVYLRKKGVVALRTKIKGAIVVTLLVSSYLYIDYAQRVVSHVLINGASRERLAAKIKPSYGLANGTKASGLTIREYQIIAALAEFPPLPPVAGNIAYKYEFDGFLPDYTLEVSYDLPLGSPVATYDSSKGRFTRSQSVEVKGAVKRVTYSEFVY